ncbi:MAG: hypothetical protein JNJ85_00030 [Candidatus Kapabacteria bacterium]|nr:hypothetical protein [Candidatus Kapabacteria bacterium]
MYNRFLRREWIKCEGRRVHNNAFKPRLIYSNQRWELSCFEISELTKLEIKDIASCNGIVLNNKAPVGYCTFINKINSKTQKLNKLFIEKDDNPLHHCNLLGWEKYEWDSPDKDVCDINEILNLITENWVNDIVDYENDNDNLNKI